jgi:hypothetical protein
LFWQDYRLERCALLFVIMAVMKRILWGSLICISVVAYIFINRPWVASPSAQIRSLKACDALTLAEAKQLLGESTAASSMNGQNDEKSADIRHTECEYTNSDGAWARVKIFVPLTSAGATANKIQYPDNKAGSQVVSGYGEKASYDPSFGMLDILKHDVWLTVSSGTKAEGGQTLNAAQKVADVVLPKIQ